MTRPCTTNKELFVAGLATFYTVFLVFAAAIAAPATGAITI